jgi:two-component system, sensor histidine kinase PdtaS
VATNLANNWAGLGDAPKALLTLKDVTARYEKPHDPTVDFSLARCYITSYTMLKQYDRAQPYCDDLLKKYDDDVNGEFVTIEVYAVVINFYISSGQYASAVKYLNRHKKLSEKFSDLSLIAENHNLWFKLDTTRHNYQSAVVHLLNYNHLNDSLFNETKSKQIAELQVQFETERKEKDILIKDQQIGMLTKEQQLKDMNLERAKFIKNIFLFGSILLLVAGALFYRQYRRKQRDSSTIARINDQLQHSLTEKEWLLREVHHRVKNNLHTIICLLESQAMYLEKDALQAIEKSQHRIFAMSLIHQKLYQNDDVKSIDMSVYLDEFIRYLKDSFDVTRIQLITEVQPIHLNLSQSIPVALIINETVTNSIKYAFTDQADAKILVSMKETEEIINLIIADNGKGFIPNEEAESKSLGIQLIKGLSKEIRAVLSINGDNGTKVTIQFEKETIPSTDKIINKELAAYEE